MSPGPVACVETGRFGLPGSGSPRVTDIRICRLFLIGRQGGNNLLFFKYNISIGRRIALRASVPGRSRRLRLRERSSRVSGTSLSSFCSITFLPHFSKSAAATRQFLSRCPDRTPTLRQSSPRTRTSTVCCPRSTGEKRLRSRAKPRPRPRSLRTTARASRFGVQPRENGLTFTRGRSGTTSLRTK